jgi:hypothetical protein
VSTIIVSPSCHGLGQEDMKRCWTSKYHLNHEKRGRLSWYLLVQQRFIYSCPKPWQEGETVMVLTSSTPMVWDKNIWSGVELVSTMTVSPSCTGLGQEDMKRLRTSTPLHIFLSQTSTRGGDCHGTY